MVIWFDTIIRRRVGIVILVVVSIVGAVGVAYVRAWLRDPILAEYPDCPFPHVPDDFPKIIPMDEPPPKSEKEAYDAYWKLRREVNQYKNAEGAMKDATKDEREAYRLAILEEEYVQARELVVKALKEDPESVPARFVLGMIEHQGEGNFPRALFLFRKIRHEMHHRGVKKPNDEIAREWYLRVLHREMWVLDNMTRNDEVLRIVDLIESVYAPYEWKRVWPLIRAQRYDEARKWLEKAEERGTYRDRLMNSRMTLEHELGRREEAYLAGKKYVETIPDSQVGWSNHSEHCACSFRFEEMEEAMWKSARSKSGTFYGSPYTYLSSMLASKGQLAEAWDALKKAQIERRERDAYTLVMDQYKFDRAAASVLFLLGHGQDALRLTRRSVERPRRSSTSSSARDLAFSSRTYLWFITRNRQHELKEVATAGGEMAEEVAAEQRRLKLEAWTLERQISALLVDEELLIKILRPYYPGAPSPGTLFSSDLIRLLPDGVARESIRHAREAESHKAAPPYFDALDAELAWRDGRYDDAAKLAKKAKENLSQKYERCLWSRVAVVAADSMRRLGKFDEAMPLYDQALSECPAVFRLLDVAIPIVIAEDGQPLSKRWSRLILNSPRFVGHPKGFLVVLRATNDDLSFEFFRPENVRYCQDTIVMQEVEDERLAFATRRLIARIISPQLDLTIADINSLENGLYSIPSSSETDRLLRLATPKD